MLYHFIFLFPIFILLFFIIFFKNAHMGAIFGTLSIFLILKIFMNLENENILILAKESIGSIIFSYDYIYIVLFIFLLTATTYTLVNSNIMDNYKNLVKNLIKSKRAMELSILTTSILMSIDDYLAMMSAKNFFGPLTNLYKISKEKLAFLLGSSCCTAASLCPFSTYSAIYLIQIGLLKESLNLTIQPYEFLFNSIPYFIFPIIILISLFSASANKINYNELDSIENKNENIEINKKNKFNFFDILIVFIPTITLFLNIFFNFLKNKLAFPNESSVFILNTINLPEKMFFGILFGFIIILISFLIKRIFSINLIYKSFFQAYNTLGASILRLVLCWIFSKSLMLLVDIKYLSLLLSNFKMFSFLLPLIFSLLALFTTLITSSSWASVGIICPLIPIFSYYSNIPLLFGAIVSGSISGLYISPLTDAIEIPSIITNCNFIDYYKIQFKFIINKIIFSLFLFLIFGLFCPSVNQTIYFWIILITVLNIFYYKNNKKLA